MRFPMWDNPSHARVSSHLWSARCFVSIWTVKPSIKAMRTSRSVSGERSSQVRQHLFFGVWQGMQQPVFFDEVPSVTAFRRRNEDSPPWFEKWTKATMQTRTRTTAVDAPLPRPPIFFPLLSTCTILVFGLFSSFSKNRYGSNRQQALTLSSMTCDCNVLVHQDLFDKTRRIPICWISILLTCKQEIYLTKHFD